MSSIDPTKRTFGITDPEGLWLLCCDCPEIDCTMWVSATQVEETTGTNACIPLTVKLVDTGSLTAGRAAFTYDNGDGPYVLDLFDDRYGLGTSGCNTRVQFLVDCVAVRNCEEGATGDMEFDIEVEINPNPENHPKWEFTLFFSRTSNSNQIVEITFPDSPINALGGQVVFSFGTTKEKAEETAVLSFCDYPQNYTMYMITQEAVLGGSRGPIYRDRHIVFNTNGMTPNPLDECDREGQITSEIYLSRVPTPLDDGMRQESTELKYVHETGKTEITGYGYFQGCHEDQYRSLMLSDTRATYFNSAGVHLLHENSSGNGYNLYSDISGNVGSYQCGIVDAWKFCNVVNAPGCNDNPDPSTGVWGSWQVENHPRSYRPITVGIQGDSGIFGGGVSVGAGIQQNGQLYGGLPAGEIPFNGFPYGNLPWDALEPFDSFGTSTASGGLWMAFDFYCGPGGGWVVATPAGRMEQGIFDHPDNPLNIKYIRIGIYANQGDYTIIPINVDCLTRGTYPFEVPVKWSVRFWGTDPGDPLDDTFDSGTTNVQCNLQIH